MSISMLSIHNSTVHFFSFTSAILSILILLFCHFSFWISSDFLSSNALVYLEQESYQLFSRSLEKGTSVTERSQMWLYTILCESIETYSRFSVSNSLLMKKPLSTNAWPCDRTKINLNTSQQHLNFELLFMNSTKNESILSSVILNCRNLSYHSLLAEWINASYHILA